MTGNIFWKILAVLCAVVFSVPSFAFAEESDFMPNVLSGQTTITNSAAAVYYGGLGGNEAVVNWANDHIFSFNKDTIYGCAGLGDISLLVPCFILNSPANSITLLRSLTYLNGTPEIETGALLYPRNTIVGDMYNSNGVNLPGFKQFGKNLYQSGSGTTGSTAFYKIGNYTFNPAAQAAWNAGNNQAMSDTISRLRSNSKDMKSSGILGASNTWMPQTFDGICISPIATISNCPEINQYPDGRVWSATVGSGDVNIAKVSGIVRKYQKKSSLIFDFSGAIRQKLQIQTDLRKIDSNSSLGVIVLNGDVYITNPDSSKKMIVEASIFAPKGNIIVTGNNIDLIGSFVAKDFIINNGATSYNINFIQDTRPSEIWPPGFRDLAPLYRNSN